VTKKPKPPPKDEGEYSAFKALLDKIAKVPKAEIEEKEREFRERPKRKAQ
jgi:hypothetical protein